MLSNNLLRVTEQRERLYKIEDSLLILSDLQNSWSGNLGGDSTNPRIVTFSFIMKRLLLGQAQTFYQSGFFSGNDLRLFFNANDQLVVSVSQNGIERQVTTDAVFRDTNAHYNFTIRINVDAISGERSRIYRDNELLIVTGIEPINGFDIEGIDNINNRIGKKVIPNSEFSSIILSEMAKVDGQDLGPETFGMFSQDGIWVPIEYDFDFGNEGWHFLFNDVDVKTLFSIPFGQFFFDQNNENNIDNKSIDTAINNYPTFNLLKPSFGKNLSKGNLRQGPASSAANTWTTEEVTFSLLGIKTAWRFTIVGNISGNNVTLGMKSFAFSLPNFSLAWENFSGSSNGRNSGLRNDGATIEDGLVGSILTGASYGTDGDTIDFAFDPSRNAIWVAVNDIWIDGSDGGASSVTVLAEIEGNGSIYILDNTSFWEFNDPIPALNINSDAIASVDIDLGQRYQGFVPPIGYKTFSIKNDNSIQDVPDSRKGFQTHLYTGTGSPHNETFNPDSKLTPDLVWIKNRDQNDEHKLTDTERGALFELNSDSDNRSTLSATGVQSFDENGFGLGTGSGGYNDLGERFVSWNWKASPKTGFEIVSYVGNSVPRDIPHSLGVAPSVIFVKQLDTPKEDWYIKHPSINSNEYLILNETSLVAIDSTIWDSNPTLNNFPLGANSAVNQLGKNYIAYIFAEKNGFSKFNSYIGNGSSNGPFINFGFKPGLFMLKGITISTEWIVLDSLRTPINKNLLSELFPNSSNDESLFPSMDFLSNGLKLKVGTAAFNSLSNKFLYMAFAQTPFGGKKLPSVSAF